MVQTFEKPLILLCVTKDLISDVINAGLVVKEVAKSLGSGGGGPSHFGTVGFNDNKLYDKYGQLEGELIFKNGKIIKSND